MTVHMNNANVLIRFADGVTEIVRSPFTYRPAEDICMSRATVTEDRPGVFRVTGIRRVETLLYDRSGEVVFDPEKLRPSRAMRDRVRTRVRREGGGLFSSGSGREVIEHVGPNGWYLDLEKSKPETRIIVGPVHLVFPEEDDPAAPEIEHAVPRSEERDRRLRVE